ncbi:hypothetical protein COUCH_18605 [Couchioplanes caeruleus]|uniref:hypothetical protein n=1 Tax=Couchioplanes caeruleus TaxID=56438 RepID=UPI0020C0A69B|nr:hypothetical protein [Couchioplanes caeruleus]UQU68165.1 hypothetical protein COUCH_18605 [Couchioplanes caeruleus]
METTTVARVIVAAGDPHATDQATQKLLKELHELREVIAVEQATVAGTTEGARSAEAIAVGTMLLTLAATPEVIGGVLTYLSGWLRRPGNRGSIRFRVGDREIELSDATPAERQKIIEAFVRELRRR